MDKFIQSFNTPVTISTLEKEVTLEFAMANKDKDFYFIPGVANKRDRLWDSDVKSTTSFFIDVDIKNNIIEFMTSLGITEITEETHIEYAEWIRDFLEQSTFFKNWSYIVFSGNGIHIHYIGKEVKIKDINSWRYGVKAIYEQWDKEIEKHIQSDILRCDKAVCNIARLRRLPGTTNQKNGRQCRILHEKESCFDTSQILPLGEQKYNEQLAQQAMQAEKERQFIKENFSNYESNIFDRINNIPIEHIVSQFDSSFEFYGDKNWRSGPQKYREGFFKTKGNRLANGGSHHFQPFTKNGVLRDSYSCFDVIHYQILGNTSYDSQAIKNTIIFIKQNYE